MEVSLVRKQVTAAIERARRGAQEHRERVAQSEAAYETFLESVAIPVIRQLAMVLKAESLPFTVSTPGGSAKLSSDNRRDDFIELRLDTASDPPEVVGRINRTRGSRTLTEDLALKPGARPDAISDEDVLTFFLKALEPWLER